MNVPKWDPDLWKADTYWNSDAWKQNIQEFKPGSFRQKAQGAWGKAQGAWGKLNKGAKKK